MSMFLDFLQNIKTYGLEFYQKYYSIYPAIVTDNKDPDQRGRIKCEAPTILGKGRTLAPWVDPLNLSLGGKSTGNLDIPYVGQVVHIGFFYGNLKFPFYIGGSLAKDEIHPDFKSNYPNVRGWILASGQKLVFDETSQKVKISLINSDGSQMIFDGASGSESVTIVHKQGSTVVMNKDGDVLIADKGGKELVNLKSGEVTINSGGKININCDGEATVVAKGNVKVEGAQVEISGKSQAVFKGQSLTDLGSSGGSTKVNGTTVQIANGALPAAKVTSTAIGVGNLGAPVVSQIIDGSPKVLIP